jgi:hypothetical protein
MFALNTFYLTLKVDEINKTTVSEKKYVIL